MTPQELIDLRDRAQASHACAEFIVKKDAHKLAEILSTGRTRLNNREIGYGSIIEALGIANGNRLIRHIKSDPNLEFVVPLLDQGRLRIGSPVTQGAIQSFVQVPDLLTQADADKLCALGRDPDQVSAADVSAALFTD